MERLPSRARQGRAAARRGGSMRVGLHALGIGTGARPEVIEAVARAAEAAGFATLWSGQRVEMVDQPSSRYPYSADCPIAVSAHHGRPDPGVGLDYAAPVTSD